MNLTTNGHLIEALGWTLVHSLWQGAVLSAILAAALRILPVSAAALRYGTACLALLTLPLLSLHTLSNQLGSGADPAPAATVAQEEGMPAATAAAGASPAPAEAGWRRSLEAVFPLIVLLWSAGVALYALRFVIGFVGLRRLRSTGIEVGPDLQRRAAELGQRLGLTRKTTILVSRRAPVPMTLGWLRPAVLLPMATLARLSPEHLEAILLHELAHIRRRDYLVNLAQSVAEAIYFYHPAVWWISRCLRVEREHCCDDLVVAIQGGARDYATALLELADATTPIVERVLAASGAMEAGRGRELFRRVERLLRKRPPRRPTGLLASGLLLVALVATVVAGGWLSSASTALAAPPQRSGEVAKILVRAWVVEAGDDLLRRLGIATGESSAAVLEKQDLDHDALEGELGRATEAGLARLLSAPSVLTLDGQEFQVRTGVQSNGGAQPVSELWIKGEPVLQEEGALLLDLELGRRLQETVATGPSPLTSTQTLATTLLLEPDHSVAWLAHSLGSGSRSRLLLFLHAEVVGWMPAPEAPGSEPIDLSLENADLRQVLASIAEVAELDLLIEPDISGTVTVELEDVPWDQALEAILHINGLTASQDGRRVIVRRKR